MTDLRTRQRALATQAIVDACADLVVDHRHLDFSMKEVAERAGVSLRTVYNHFSTREELLDELTRVLDEQGAAMGAPSAEDLETRDDLVRAVHRNHEIFESLGELSEAIAQMPLADVGRDEARVARTRRITDFLAGQMPSVPPDDARAIALVLRHLLSHRSWFWLTREYGLDTDTVSRIVTWTVETIIEAAESGDLPTPLGES